MQNGFMPGLFVTTSNIPGATYNADGSLANRSIVCAHMDRRTTGGSVVIPWAQFDLRDFDGKGSFNWTFVDEQMKPWVDRNQMVNLLVWPAVQKKSQLFPNGESATPDYIMKGLGMTYQLLGEVTRTKDGRSKNLTRTRNVPPKCNKQVTSKQQTRSFLTSIN
jgi:hypothetical protein